MKYIEEQQVLVSSSEIAGVGRATIAEVFPDKSGYGHEFDYKIRDKDGFTWLVFENELEQVPFSGDLTDTEKVAKAKRLLEEAGYEIDHIDGGFQAWETPSGE